MPRASKNLTLERWGALLRAVRRTEAELPGVASFRFALERTYIAALSSHIMQAAAQASARKATQRLQANLAAGRDAAICLQSFIRGVLGPRSEKLRDYGMKPIQKRRPLGRKPIGFEPPSQGSTS